MPPSRRVHASAPVDKYFPSNSLVIGMNIFLSLPFPLQFRCRSFNFTLSTFEELETTRDL